MITWLKKPHVILGISVGIGVIYAVRVLRRPTEEVIIRPSSESNRITRSLKIPKGFVGHVLGKGGSTIKGIREKSKARITFDDSDKEFTTASISGSPTQVDNAVELINEILSNRHECVTKEIQLLDDLTDSVWKNINHIRQICDMTHAKILFDFHPAKRHDSHVKVVIKGRKEEVDSAMELIDELMAEGEVNETNKTQIHMAGRALPEKMPGHANSFDNRDLPREKLIPSSSDGFVEVYVSSVKSPNKFWLQLSGSKSIQLDKLATEMTEFYNEERNKERFQLHTINIGDIVSAFSDGDNSWYRAQVTNVSDEKKISVFYLDFGDNATLDPALVSLLKPEYLSIPFQAIECTLPDILPIGEEGWTQEAIDDFEKMVSWGQWKVMMAKPLAEYSNNVVPVQLLDTNTARDINISEELVVKAFAKFIAMDSK